MHTSPLAPRPARPVPIHAVVPLENSDQRSDTSHSRAPSDATRRAQATSKAMQRNEPLSDWQVFTLLGGTAGGMLTFGIAALYGLSLLLS